LDSLQQLGKLGDMKLAIMQPYFLPYIGYFQLIAAVDVFIVYDNIKYTKKGWINRNRMLQNGADIMFSLPLKSDSDYLDIRERQLSADFNRGKLLNQLKGAYQRAPYFSQTFPLVEQIVLYDDVNLFRFLHHSIVRLCEHFEIKTEIKFSSQLTMTLQGRIRCFHCVKQRALKLILMLLVVWSCIQKRRFCSRALN
jgi:hypothetical protein